MRGVVLGLFALAITGCYGADPHVLYVQTGEFSANEMKALRDAADVWREASGGQLSIEIVTTGKVQVPYIRPSSTDDVFERVRNAYGFSSMCGLNVHRDGILLNHDDPTCSFAEAARHEMGHWFGAAHLSAGIEGVMHPGQTGIPALTVTCADLTDACQHAGCDASTMPACAPSTP
jgi:hypothetical protein